jgi:flagellar hook-length control protein FliK
MKGGESVEVRGLGNLYPLSDKSEKQNSGSVSEFSESLAALLYSMQLTVHSKQNDIEGQVLDISNSSRNQVSVSDNLGSLISQMKLVNDFIDPLKNGESLDVKLDELLKSNSANIEGILKLLNCDNSQNAKADDFSKLLQIITEDINKGVEDSQINAASVSSLDEQNLERTFVNMKAEFADLENPKLDAEEVDIVTLHGEDKHKKIAENTNSQLQEKSKDFSSLNSSNSEEKFKSTNIKESHQNIQNGFYDILNTKSDIKVAAQDIVNIAKPEDIVEVVIDKFKSMRLPGTTELKVKLRPEELGEITIKVILEKGQINGSIHADRKEVVNMLQSQMENLKQDLKNNNVNLSNISVNISSDSNYDESQRRFFSQDQRRGNRSFFEQIEDDQQNINKEDGFNIVV